VGVRENIVLLRLTRDSHIEGNESHGYRYIYWQDVVVYRVLSFGLS
jgi:hypothetical protein